ncbi:hypothetical protein [Sciscionella sediminilitoris]|uniref:hypothetical protein n=1 Tax=Sciscionella sediminilitoris TaxID=1445613 RepID=UPI0012E18B99|nr:hypothetical protein [Sciscionella sp. SE31]
MSWLVNRTGGAVLIAMLWHATLIGRGVVALGLVVATRGRLGYRHAQWMRSSSVLSYRGS